MKKKKFKLHAISQIIQTLNKKYQSEYIKGYPATKADIEDIKHTLSVYKDSLIQLYEEELLPTENDWRSGKDTYGYKSPHQIMERFDYISYRWCAAFCVRWLINLIDPDYYPNLEEVFNVN